MEQPKNLHMTHRHEQWCGDCLKQWGVLGRGEQRGENWDNFKRSNISIIVVPEGEEKEQGTRNLSEKIVKEIFLNLVKEIDSKSRKHRES